MKLKWNIPHDALLLCLVHSKYSVNVNYWYIIFYSYDELFPGLSLISNDNRLLSAPLSIPCKYDKASLDHAIIIHRAKPGTIPTDKNCCSTIYMYFT